MQLSFELLSFVLSIVSLLVSAGAVWLSFKFYQMSDHASKEAQRSSDQIQVNTEKLEGLFSKLYSDTFSMMKDTVTDMRQHIYHNSDKEDSLEEKLTAMKETINNEVKETLDENMKELKDNNLKINEIEKNLASIVNKQVDVIIEDTVTSKHKKAVIKTLLEIIRISGRITVSHIKNIAETTYKLYMTDSELLEFLKEFKTQKIIKWIGDEEDLNLKTMIVSNM
ncbi:hypothetical protein [Providencia rettgeri]|uniref:hypothetical protein n=1 Tax=Providencia rettgeri TaxID=587 RepID=UPI002360F7A4|nr:hypothetical protein [Providencia rettgeri]